MALLSQIEHPVGIDGRDSARAQALDVQGQWRGALLILQSLFPLARRSLESFALPRERPALLVVARWTSCARGTVRPGVLPSANEVATDVVSCACEGRPGITQPDQQEAGRGRGVSQTAVRTRDRGRSKGEGG